MGFFFWAKFGHLLTPKKKDGTCPKEFFWAKKRAKVAISEGKKKASTHHILGSLHSFYFFFNDGPIKMAHCTKKKVGLVKHPN